MVLGEFSGCRVQRRIVVTMLNNDYKEFIMHEAQTETRTEDVPKANAPFRIELFYKCQRQSGGLLEM